MIIMSDFLSFVPKVLLLNYPEPSKSFLLVNDRHRSEAEKLLSALGVWIVHVKVSWVVIWVIKLIVYNMYLTRLSCGSQICCLLQRLL